MEELDLFGNIINQPQEHNRGIQYSQQDFITKANKVHNYKYDYSETKYVNSYTKIKIKCPMHGYFYQKAGNHLHGNGCYYCGRVSSGEKHSLQKTKTTQDFIKASKKKHNNLYDYSLVKYKNNRTKVQIICKKHGIFEQRPDAHLIGAGCQKCAKEHRYYTQEEFVKKAKKVHNSKYDYSKVKYKSSKEKVPIICIKHGIFYQAPQDHLAGKGCPFCRESKGERLIKKYLLENNIQFEQQKKFKDLIDKSPLSYDFYIPKYKVLIEFQGIQHYKIVEKFKKKENTYETQIFHDKLKSNYAKEKGYKLLIISYKEKIDAKLNKFFKEL